jgi:hypothetical protein
METPCIVFCCYARKDQEFLLELKAHLAPLEREGLILLRDDIDISPGMRWETTLTHYLEKADIVLLLISSDFIASNYCVDREMQHAMERDKQGTARVVPVIVRPTSWHKMPFGKLQALPKNAAPISTATNRDVAYLSIVKGVHTIVHELTANGHGKPTSTMTLQEASGQANPLSAYSAYQEGNDVNTKDNASKYTINNHATGGQSAMGENAAIHNTNNYYSNPPPKDGLQSLKRGERALWNRDFSPARRELRVAIDEIDQAEHRKETAKAYYLQALAMLDNERPHDKGITEMSQISRSLNVAIELDQCYAYIMTMAAIKNPSLQKPIAGVYITGDDLALLEYLNRCQPDLYFQIRRVSNF